MQLLYDKGGVDVDAFDIFWRLKLEVDDSQGGEIAGKIHSTGGRQCRQICRLWGWFGGRKRRHCRSCIRSGLLIFILRRYKILANWIIVLCGGDEIGSKAL